MKQAGATNKGLARRVRLLSEQDGGEPVRCDHVSVKRWLDGTTRQPHPRTCQLIAQVLGELLGRAVTLAEIGYAETTDDDAGSELGLEYAEEVAQTVATLGAITDLELRTPKKVEPLTVVPQAWSELVVRWLTDSDADRSRLPSESRRISLVDVEAIREATAMFSSFDYKYGGGRPKSLVASFLDQEVLPNIRRASPSDPVGREYFREVAALTRLAGWTAYDTGAHGLAQRYLTQAFRLAKAAGDKPLCGRILAGMSHQANFLGHYQRAVDLARAAYKGANGYATPTTMALFYAMEARAQASLGREEEATAALLTAERWHGQGNPEDDPEWIRYFDAAELHAEFAHSFRDLGNAELANHHAAASIRDAGSTYVRSLSFVRTVLATSHLQDGNLDEALYIARSVVETAAGLKSLRVISYLDDFRSRLAMFSSAPLVREFLEFVQIHLPSEDAPVSGRLLVA
jgi:tetratricopeptide (TPR) repeat protein